MTNTNQSPIVVFVVGNKKVFTVHATFTRNLEPATPGRESHKDGYDPFEHSSHLGSMNSYTSPSFANQQQYQHQQAWSWSTPGPSYTPNSGHTSNPYDQHHSNYHHAPWPNSAVSRDIIPAGYYANHTNASEDIDMDVDMTDDASNAVVAAPAPVLRPIYLIVDTNILLHHLPVFRRFVADVERQSALHGCLNVIVPRAVADELERQKKGRREEVKRLAADALRWLATMATTRKPQLVREQRIEETCIKPEDRGSLEDDERAADLLISDCCKYFDAIYRPKGAKTVLCTNDTLLRFENESALIETIALVRELPFSRTIAQKIFGGSQDGSASSIDLNAFDCLGDKARADANAMLVDAYGRVDYRDESHHRAVSDLVYLLRHLARAANALFFEGHPLPTNAVSRYDAEYELKTTAWEDWSAAQCLAFLRHRVPDTSPPLDGPGQRREALLGMFLSLRPARGAKCGREWTTQAWGDAVQALRRVGEEWAALGTHSESLLVAAARLESAYELYLVHSHTPMSRIY